MRRQVNCAGANAHALRAKGLHRPLRAGGGHAALHGRGQQALPLPPTPPPSFTTGPSKRSPPPSPPPEATPLGWRGQPSMLSSWHVRTYAGPDPQWGPSFCLSTESDEDAGARYRTRDGHPGMIQLQCQPIEICKPPRVAERGPHASPCIAAPWARTRCPSPSAYRWRSRPTSAPWVLPTASPQSCCWTAVSWTRRHT